MAAGLVWLAVAGSGTAATPDPAALFRRALQVEIEGDGPEAARQAFMLYRQAARAGLPEAEFNVGVMLDSGRGVTPNQVEAALWYARAAARGNARGAYNLGQLYENGQGVPRNRALSRAWYAASGLPAAQLHLAAPAPRPAARLYTPPVPLSPEADTLVTAAPGGVELVWTAREQPGPSRFFVELRALEGGGSREVLNRFVDTSSLLAPLPAPEGLFAWRVSAVAAEAGRYVASDWTQFTVALPPAD